MTIEQYIDGVGRKYILFLFFLSVGPWEWGCDHHAAMLIQSPIVRILLTPSVCMCKATTGWLPIVTGLPPVWVELPNPTEINSLHVAIQKISTKLCSYNFQGSVILYWCNCSWSVCDDFSTLD